MSDAEQLADARRTTASTPDMDDAFLTVDEAAAELRCNRKTLLSAIRRGEVPGVIRLGRVIRINRALLLASLATGQGRRSQKK